jgi:DNA-binding CsgD family transcriptional regulator
VALLEKPGVGLVTLTGVPGIGKTRLAIETALHFAARERSVAWVDLSGVSEPREIFPAFLRAMGVNAAHSAADTGQLLQRLGDAPLLVTLDNFEQIFSGASVVAALLQTYPEMTLLVTSRGPLRIRGEHEFRLGPLAATTSEDAAPDITLFLDRAAVGSQYRGGNIDGEMLSAICRKLEGNPLAIELAAGLTSILTPAELLSGLDYPLRLLTEGPADLPERQQSLWHAIAWSYDLLTPDEQRLLHRLSVFDEGFTLHDAEMLLERVGDRAIDLLVCVGGLVRHGLLLAPGMCSLSVACRGKFCFPAMIREFGRECLIGLNELAATVACLEGFRAECLENAPIEPVHPTAVPFDSPMPALSPRELQVLQLLQQGLTNRLIAQELGIGKRTVDTHVEHLRNKLGLSQRAQLSAWAAVNSAKLN